MTIKRNGTYYICNNYVFCQSLIIMLYSESCSGMNVCINCMHACMTCISIGSYISVYLLTLVIVCLYIYIYIYILAITLIMYMNLFFLQ